ncbi:MAG TPA: M81 family metallopeptidase [Burkholderiales bacterium]|nr:M81 family metallopeptidase [Burkholderiales bacterium]
MTSNPRIAILGIHLESNAFAPVTTEADFRASCYFEGEAMLAEAAKPAPAMPAEIPGFVEAMNASGAWEPVPIVITATEPGGAADAAFIDKVLARMRSMLAEAGPLDGIYVSNHGAMVSTADSDPDGALYALAREFAGPELPVVATVDLHANISQRMVDSADVIISYRTNPHVDRKERGAEAAPILRRLLAGERFEKTFIPMPIAAPTVTLLTARGAYADMIVEGQRHIGPDLPVVSVLGGFAFADAPEAGISILTYGRGEKPKQLALDLAKFAWKERDRFKVKLTSLEDAIARMVAAGREKRATAVCLADVADNPGGGGRGNTTDILTGLLNARAENALLGNFVDPAAAERCHAAGAGAKLRIVLNAGRADAHAKEIPVDLEVLALSDGRVAGRRGIYKGRTALMGKTAAVRIGGLTMVVCSRRIQCADPAFFEHLGLDVGSFSSLTVKSRGHFRAGFDEWYPDASIFEVDAAGLTSPLLERFPWKALRRPVWPLDAETSWYPPRLEDL